MDFKLLLARLMGDQAFREAQAQALSTGKGYDFQPRISRAGTLNPILQNAENMESRREELFGNIARELGPPPPGFYDLQRNLEMRQQVQKNRDAILQNALKVGV